MKKYSEMNGIEKIAYKNVKGIFNWELGGWYNCILDGCEEYIPDTIEQAKQIIYTESMEDYATVGRYASGRAPKEMRFAGTEFIMSCVDYLFDKDEEGDVEEIRAAKNW